MNMTPDEQRALAIEKGAIVKHWRGIIGDDYDDFTLSTNELAAYTAAVEAKERERCAVVCDDSHYNWRFDNEPDSSSGPRECRDAIRSLK